MRPEADIRNVRLFVSSPGDVEHERLRVARVVERLNVEFTGAVHIETIRWETKFYSAHATFQKQIPEAADCDIVIAIFWSRLGTELPADFPRMEDNEPYPSGSAYEVLSAIQARQTKTYPDVFVFRKDEQPKVPLDDRQQLQQALEQWEKLGGFFQRWFVTPQGHFVAAFQTFHTTDEFEERLEALLRDWGSRHALSGGPPWPVEIKGSPFRGLEPFDARYTLVFFGRARDIARAAQRLKTATIPFLLILGASGAGKSSLARAGLIPRMCAPGFIAEVDLWRVAVMRPAAGSTPIYALAEALFAESTESAGIARALPELATGDYPTPQSLGHLLSRGDESAVRPIIEALNRIAAEEQIRGGFDQMLRVDLLLVVDQLDDLFTNDQPETTQQSFAQLLMALVRTGRVRVITTLRGILYEQFLDNPILRDLKQSGADYDLSRPGPADLADIVRGPARAAGLRFGQNEYGISLDDRVLEDAAGADPLPLLEFTLQRLYETRDGSDLSFAAYEAMGGLGGSINQAAESVIAAHPNYSIELARLLRQLLVPVQESTEAASAQPALTIRSVPIAEAGPEHTAVRALIDALVEVRILTVDRDGRVPTVRLAHQRVIENWHRAREIAKSNADFYRIRRDVEEQQSRWEKSGRKPELLLAYGIPLGEAEKLTAGYSDELASSTRAYVKASGRRARARQRITMAAAIGAMILGAAATAGGLWAWSAQILAETERGQSIAIQSSFLAGLARQAHDRGDNKTAIALALEALPDVTSMDNRQKQNSAEAILYAAIADYSASNTNKLITVFFSPDGGRIATVMADFSVQILDAATRNAITVLKGNVDQVASGIFSPDGSRIATASLDRNVRLWDAQSGDLLRTMIGQTDAVIGVAFSPDSRLLVSTSLDKTAFVREAQSGMLLASLRHDAAATGGAFSPDGAHLAVAVSNNSVVTWDMGTHKQQYVLKHSDRVIAVAYSLDGRRIASASPLGDVSIWDATTGGRIAVLQAPSH